MACVGKIDLDYNTIELDFPFIKHLDAVLDAVSRAISAGLIDEDFPYTPDNHESPMCLTGAAWAEYLEAFDVHLEHVETDSSPGHCQRLVYVHVESETEANSLANALKHKYDEIEEVL